MQVLDDFAHSRGTRTFDRHDITGLKKMPQRRDCAVGRRPHSAPHPLGQSLVEGGHGVADEKHAIDLRTFERPEELSVKSLGCVAELEHVTEYRHSSAAGTGSGSREYPKRGTHRRRARIVTLVDQSQGPATPSQLVTPAAAGQRFELAQRLRGAFNADVDYRCDGEDGKRIRHPMPSDDR